MLRSHQKCCKFCTRVDPMQSECMDANAAYYRRMTQIERCEKFAQCWVMNANYLYGAEVAKVTLWRSGSCSVPTMNYSYTLSYSLNVLLLCHDSFCTHDIYYTCPSWRGILLCCSPEGFFPFFPVKGFFLFLGSFSWSDVRSCDRDVFVYRL